MEFFSLKRVLSISFLLVGALSLSGCGAAPAPSVTYDVNLEIWGIFDDSSVFSPAIAEYKKINPNVKNITYRKLAVETYKDDLINAFASGKGPDIFLIRNSWRKAFEDKSAPAPTALISEQEYRNRLVDVVADDFINADKQIYGVPLSVDSLALYYNKDLFNVAGITRPPETWDEVVEHTRLLTSIDQFGSFTRSGIALGTGTNINRSSDILIAIMMQYGAELSTQGQEHQVSLSGQKSEQAYDFYAQFAQITSDVYSWNIRQDYSVDAFYKGNLAMMINYSWQYETIKQKNAKLNIGIAPLPQLDKTNPTNLANYWGFAVSKNMPAVTSGAPVAMTLSPDKQNEARIFEAWQFLKYLTLAGKDKSVKLTSAFSGVSKEFPLETDPTEAYLLETNKPAARRDLVAKQQNDLILSPFAYGNLIAKNWYQGDSDAADGVLIDMIDSIGRGEKSVPTAFNTASSRINLFTR